MTAGPPPRDDLRTNHPPVLELGAAAVVFAAWAHMFAAASVAANSAVVRSASAAGAGGRWDAEAKAVVGEAAVAEAAVRYGDGETNDGH